VRLFNRQQFFAVQRSQKSKQSSFARLYDGSMGNIS